MAEDKKKEIDVTVIEVTEEYLKEKQYKIRGKRVLLDADLAEIYGYDTKGFNRQVKNNIEKFDEDFMFELTDEELEDLRYKNCTANISSKSRYNPHVFTEQGLYMLMTVLKGPLAVKQSKALIRTFNRMKDYILENRDLIGQRELLQLSMLYLFFDMKLYRILFLTKYRWFPFQKGYGNKKCQKFGNRHC